MNLIKFSVLILAFVLNASCSDEEQYKLVYFDIRGRGEFIRFIFAAAEQKFEDDRIKDVDWPSLKPRMPFNQLPVLGIKHKDGETTVLAQSLAIGTPQLKLSLD
jgi:hypothetical protein